MALKKVTLKLVNSKKINQIDSITNTIFIKLAASSGILVMSISVKILSVSTQSGQCLVKQSGESQLLMENNPFYKQLSVVEVGVRPLAFVSCD